MKLKPKSFLVAMMLLLFVIIAFAAFQWPPVPIQALPGVTADGAQGLTIQGSISKVNSVTASGTVAANLVKQTTGTVIASATTIAPVSAITHVSGTTAIATITLPFTGFTGCIVLVPDGIFTTTTAGNISLASTAVVNKVLTECYDGTKWNPSY